MHAHERGDKAASPECARSPARPVPVGHAAEVLALQRTVGNAATAALIQQDSSRVHEVLRSSGRPLAEPLRAEMESRLGADFSGVRVHSDQAARRSAAGLGARAYTSGEHVVIGAGGANKHTLAHELAHVVQQRSGPVAGTETAGGLKISDPTDRFEREAEATAVSAMSGPTPSPLQREEDPAEPATPGGDPEVQRKVGFEFETGWKVTKTGFLGLGRPSPLKKKDPIGQSFTGFKLEADEAGGGESEVEFIVHPPVEEDEAGYEALDKTMSEIFNLGLRMQNVARNTTEGPFQFNAASRRDGDSAFLILPTADKLLTAGPQVTSGLDLAKVPQLETVSQAGAPIPESLGRTASGLQGRASSMTSATRDLSPELRGLLALLTGYLDAGTTSHKNSLSSLDDDTRHLIALNYPKQIGDVLLARTDLPTLFGLLREEEREHWQADPDGWIDLVLSNTDPAPGLTAGDSVISRGVKVDENDPAKGVVTPALTIGAWLRGILTGTDLLSRVPDAESMGEFGTRTEQAGAATTARQVGIFEFRGAQATKIPLADWWGFATAFHRYISQLHGPNESG